MSIKMQVGKPYLQTEIEPKRITGNLSRRIQLPQDYNDLTNKPSINEIELVGDLSLDDLGIASAESVEELSEAIEGKQDTLTFDSVPTQNSQNPVQSGGVYDALTGHLPRQNIQRDIHRADAQSSGLSLQKRRDPALDRAGVKEETCSTEFNFPTRSMTS